MLTRRSFLHTGLLAAGLPLSMRLQAHNLPANIRVVIDQACPGASDWVAACGATAIAHDAGDCLATVGDELQRGAIEAVVGLTRDSHQFLFTHIAASHGYHLAYRGDHTYTGDHLRHALSGDHAVIAAVGKSLLQASDRWQHVLLDELPVLATGVAATAGVIVQRRLARPDSVPAYLVSWSLRRGQRP